jgi:predicted enzyme related to lactoylglutathione lyase
MVQVDSKVSSGPCGSIVNLNVEDFHESLKQFQAVGVTLYRGPMRIEDGKMMCQVQDRWGNCISLRGKGSQTI